LQREVCADVKQLQTTITRDNDASWALFRKFAGNHGTKLGVQAYYTQALHFRDQHSTEHMVTIDLNKERMRAAA